MDTKHFSRSCRIKRMFQEVAFSIFNQSSPYNKCKSFTKAQNLLPRQQNISFEEKKSPRNSIRDKLQEHSAFIKGRVHTTEQSRNFIWRQKTRSTEFPLQWYQHSYNRHPQGRPYPKYSLERSKDLHCLLFFTLFVWFNFL